MNYPLNLIPFITSILVFGALAEYYNVRRRSGFGEDARGAMIEDALSGCDCGRCGYESCREFAAAALKNPVLINLCTESHSELVKRSSEIWGYSFDGDIELAVARVKCAAVSDVCAEKFKYYGVKNCAGVSLLWNGNRECGYGCVGFQDCRNVCPVGAIDFVGDFLPRINENICVGCGKCAEACPVGVITLQPREPKTYIKCNTKIEGIKVRKSCSAGCISCQVCVKVCPHHAIEYTSGVPAIIFDRCTDCGICVLKCPTGVIECRKSGGNIVVIDSEKCNNCGICAEICPASAVMRVENGKHKIIGEKCIGCGRCGARCPREAINLKISE